MGLDMVQNLLPKIFGQILVHEVMKIIILRVVVDRVPEFQKFGAFTRLKKKIRFFLPWSLPLCPSSSSSLLALPYLNNIDHGT
jgi:hypothetical protein